MISKQINLFAGSLIIDLHFGELLDPYEVARL